MKTKFYIRDVGGKNVVVGVKGHRPKGLVAECPKIDGKYVLDIEVIDINDVPDGEGGFKKQADVNLVKKAAKESAANEDRAIKKARSYMRELVDLKENKALQLEAIVRGDTVIINQIRTAIKFIDMVEYRREDLVGRAKYMAIVEDSPGVFLIQEFDRGSKPGNFVMMAPPGFVPGDEEFLSYDSDKGEFSIDWTRRLQKFNDVEKGVDEVRKRDEWNASSPLDRIKSRVFKGGN